MKHDALFSELRSLAQRPASPQTWVEVTDLVRTVDDDGIQRFTDELVPYLDASFASWPDELRVADDLNDPLSVRLIARTLIFDEDAGAPNTTQAVIKAHSRHVWSTPTSARITRVEIRRVRNNLGRLFDAVTRDLDGLESIVVRGHFDTQPDPSPQMKGTPVLGGDFVDMAIDRHGPTLTCLGLQETWSEGRGKSATTRTAWNALFSRLDELPNLRALHVRQDIELDTTLNTILSDPRLDALDELHVVGYTRKFDPSWFTERPASRNLRRVRIRPISDAHAHALVSSPNLSGVTCWELHETGATDTNTWGWGSDRSKVWASHSPFIELSNDDMLATRWLDLSRLHRHELHALLFEGSGDLRTSERVHGAALGHLLREDLRTLFAQTHEAMPELRALVFHQGFVMRPSDVRALSASPLIDHLDALWIRATSATSANSSGSPHIVVKDRRVWFGLASDDPLHPALRLHAWRCATFGRSLSDLRSMCRALGVPNYTRLDREELTANVVAHVPDVFDDPRHAILDADIPPELDPNGVVSFHRTNDPDTLR